MMWQSTQHSVTERLCLLPKLLPPSRAAGTALFIPGNENREFAPKSLHNLARGVMARSSALVTSVPQLSHNLAEVCSVVEDAGLYWAVCDSRGYFM
jgi:hypothetical protein